MESFILLNNNEIERKYVFCIEIYYLLTCLYYNKLVLNRCEEININCHYIKCDIKPIERPVQQSNQPNQSITNGNSNPTNPTHLQVIKQKILPHRQKTILKGDIITCAICLEDFDKSRTIITPCGHKFHLTCYNQLKSNNHTQCPICKINLQI